MTQHLDNTQPSLLNLIHNHKLRLLGLSLLTVFTLNGCDKTPEAPATPETNSETKVPTVSDAKPSAEQYLELQQKAKYEFAQKHQSDINAAGAMPFEDFYLAVKACWRPQNPSVHCRAVNLIGEERFNAEAERLNQAHPGTELAAHTESVCTAKPVNDAACELSMKALKSRQQP